MTQPLPSRSSRPTRSDRRNSAKSRSSADALLRQGIVRSLAVASAYKPRRNSLVLTVPTFFSSWLVSEAAPELLAIWGFRTARGVSRARHEDEGLGVKGWVGLGLSAAASLGAVGLIREALRSKEELDASLSSLIPAKELAEAPSSVRLGALLPLLNGNRRRKRSRNVVFNTPLPGQARGPKLKLDVYTPLEKPSAGEKRPAVLQIHGGAWILGSKDEQGIPLLNHLASCGWVGFNANYRLSPKVHYPDHLVDCKTALAWIREHADEYNVDPDFIVVTGGSAGGHLCALVALTQNDKAFQPGFEDADTSVQAAVPFYGVYDLTDRERLNGREFRQLMAKVVMGFGQDDRLEDWAAYSPLDRITDEAPPMMILHGDRDVLVPVEGARRFAADLRDVSKNHVVYSELHGAQHAFEIFPSIRTVNTVEAVERFLHHVHGEYLATRDSSPEAAEPTPDDDAVAEIS
ncbi:MAG: alpha/beta hydrolase [Microthrixaceae bacterium]